MPGAPFKASTNKPVSSDIVGIFVILKTVLDLINAFSSKDKPSSIISLMSGKSLRVKILISESLNDSCNSLHLSKLCVAKIIYIKMIFY